MTVTDRIFLLQDKEYALFQAKLTPTVPIEKFIGARVPKLRLLAKELIKEGNYKDFISSPVHDYYDENMLHGLLLSEIKDYDTAISEVEKFLPYVDNWAVCDIMSPKVFRKHKEELYERIKVWLKSSHVYTIRFGIEMLMSFYLDEDFKAEYLSLPSKVKSNEYYVNMMIAWFYATALSKRWEDAVGYVESGVLEKWTHNKTIQKARESYRITDSQKEYLNSLKK